MPAYCVITIGVLTDVMFLGSNCLSLVLGVSSGTNIGRDGIIVKHSFWRKKEYKSKGNQASLILLLVDNFFILNTCFRGEFVSLCEETRLDLSLK